MKKIILFSLLGMLLYTRGVSGAELAPVCTTPAGLWVKFEITFHRPKMDCLRGFGICFDVTAGLEESMGSSNTAKCPVRGYLNGKNQLVIEVTEGALNKYEGGSTLPYLKNKNSITLSDPYTFSAGTSKALGSATPITIKEGDYPVTYSNGTYTIVFQL
ncbi:MAG: hypothetical protein M0P47_02610 [Bacteroidales bacterium]|nr:hypothetical protein [Bacteroidales bacterium]